MEEENFDLHKMCAPRTYYNFFKKHFLENLRYVPCQNLLLLLFLFLQKFFYFFVRKLGNKKRLLCNSIFSKILQLLLKFKLTHTTFTIFGNYGILVHKS